MRYDICFKNSKSPRKNCENIKSSTKFVDTSTDMVDLGFRNEVAPGGRPKNNREITLKQYNFDFYIIWKFLGLVSVSFQNLVHPRGGVREKVAVAPRHQK